MKTGFILVLLASSMMMPFAFADDVETPEVEEPEIEPLEVESTEESGPNNGLHKGQNKENGAVHLYLYEKDPETWDIVDDGSWGKLTFLPHRDKYVFNGHRLPPDAMYDFINYAPSTDWTEDPYPNPWPGDDSVSIATEKVNKGGNVHMRGTWSAEYVGKVWLVLAGDFDESGMIGWNPTDYLFEFDLIKPRVPV